MDPFAPLLLTPEQGQRLLTALQTYRRYALTQLAPSTERNARQRVLQAFQGKLLAESERGRPGAMSSLMVTGEERDALNAMVDELLALAAQGTATNQRRLMLDDLSALKAIFEKHTRSEMERHRRGTPLQQMKKE